ncbi:MAG: SDR family NAD(P)-dependent oxidoreductase [Candidatus Dojkabacteria bacterium]|nr:SDR family NAD(P)-dependent oxidoreductase [Candidatus Dojkabacteria bacterium]
MKKIEKKVLILGANAGLGLALVKHYSISHSVVAVSRSTNGLEKINSDNLRIMKADIVEDIPEFEDSFDLIFNCLGIASFKALKDISNEEIEKVVNTNLVLAIKLSRQYVNNLNAEGVFIYIGSHAGLEIGHANFSVYSASKMGLIGLANSLTKEFENENKLFLTVLPPAFKSNICKDSVGGDELQKLFDSSNVFKPEQIVTKIVKALPEVIRNKKTQLFIGYDN